MRLSRDKVKIQIRIAAVPFRELTPPSGPISYDDFLIYAARTIGGGNKANELNFITSRRPDSQKVVRAVWRGKTFATWVAEPRKRKGIVTRLPQYDREGNRLTDCCGVYSTYVEGMEEQPLLVCRNCYQQVPRGQGDKDPEREGPIEMGDSPGEPEDPADWWKN